ncbi:tRNA (adenosine(37)-N6)-dimethylallyltransferase MiaA [Buchnera aphidicola]|nr:tRNA (adenosine(37)-N6)-dimethylallyltransferase MiaA [Buchnera aphidicola]
MGPTACGKSQVAINLRKHLPIELISVDSALIYKGMDIGTDKPSIFDLLNHPHRLINIKDPIESYSASEFLNDALSEISDIIKSNKIPCLVGGTMFYYKTLLKGLPILPPSNFKIREYLLQKKIEKNFLHEQLLLVDPISAIRIHKNDHQRLLRALEIFYISGKNLTELTNENNYKLPYTVVQFAIIPPNKNWINEKIKLRVKRILNANFQKEVETLFFRGDLSLKLPSIRCIGYRQMWKYLEYKISYRDMFYEIIYATRKLAKHQLTWLNKWKNINILKSDLNAIQIITKIFKIIINKISI